jgi:folate-dependent phosphoribosylglycinamide formyltransferase PurN
MSGQGSNANTLLSRTDLRDLYDINLIVSDKKESRAVELGETYNVDTLVLPVGRFKTTQERVDYFAGMSKELGQAGVQAAFYAGFMKIVSPQFCVEFPGVNVHPANLEIMGDDGLPKYRGMHAISDMRADLGYAQSTVHVVDPEVDSGTALAISSRVYPESESETDADLHERLKAYEHRIFPHTLALLGQGLVDVEQLPIYLEDL